MSMEIPKEVSRDILASESGSSTESRVTWFHHMQETQPVRYRPEYNLWEVFRYKDVQQVFLDNATFSVDKSLPEGFPSVLGKSDPPEHRRVRSLVSKVFAPRRIEELTPRLVKMVDELLALAIPRGKMNVAAELAYPLPLRVITETLGLPLEEQERFRQWSYQLIDQLLGMKSSDNNEIIQYFSDLLNERKRDPRDDLMSALLVAEENGAHLTREEIIFMCVELMLAGHVTASLLLIFALRRLCLHPEIYQALRADPSLIPQTIEETLRYDFSFLNLWRTARYDTMLGGQQIKAGQYVVAWAGAANFDETYFPHSEQFDIRRSPNPHLAFGHGIHACLGSFLARLEGRIVLERIVAHFSEIRLDLEKPLQFLGQTSSNPLPFLGILFTQADK